MASAMPQMVTSQDPGIHQALMEQQMMQQQPVSFVGATSSKIGLDGFENDFAEMALDQLQKVAPELVQHYSTFKIVEVSPERGTAFGNFIFLLDNGTLYVPVILDKDSIKPFDVMYVKELGRFLPFSKSWIDYLAALADPVLGQTDNQKTRMVGDSPQEVQLHDLLTPPRTTRKPVVGKSSYASSDKTAEDAYLNFLDEVPNNIKDYYLNYIKTSEDTLQYLINNYDIKEVQRALTFRKEAQVEKTQPGVFVVSKETLPKATLIKLCQKFPEVARDINSLGVSVLDMRSPSDIINRVQRWENYRFFDSPNEGGIYRIHMKDGQVKNALVFPNINKHSWSNTRGGNWETADELKETFLVVFLDGGYCYTKHMLANKLPMTREQIKETSQALAKAAPELGDRGAWMYRAGGSYNATPCVDVTRIVIKNATTRYFTAGVEDKVVSQSMDATSQRLFVSRSTNLVTIPSSAIFLKLTHEIPAKELLKTFDDLKYFIKESGDNNLCVLEKKGSFYVLNNSESEPGINMIAKIANDLSVPLNEAIDLVKAVDASEDFSYTFMLEKEAADAKKDSKKEPKKDAKKDSKSNGKQKPQDPAAMMPQRGLMDVQDPVTGQVGGQGLAPVSTPLTPEQEMMMYAAPIMTNFKMNPVLIQKVIELGVQGLFESATIASLVAIREISEVAVKYMPVFRETLDSLSRMLLAMRYKADYYREELGDEGFERLENNTADVLTDLGDLVLLVNKNVGKMSQSINTLSTDNNAPY